MGDPSSGSCPSCGGQNTADAKFCTHCGTALVAVCPSCGHRNPPSGSFCTECGSALTARELVPRFASPSDYTPESLAAKIRENSRSLEGERKLITAMFTDVAGFTKTAESLDPEDVQGIMQRCFDLMLEEVHRFEGTVSQFLGDGMLALFGAPIAHEDHAQRAVRAALAIQSTLTGYQDELARRGIDFRTRIGLNSGPVVVGSVGVDLSVSYTAVGDTMNLAARMQTLAPEGSVAISEATRDLVEGYFVLRDMGTFDVKGKGEQRAWEVQGPGRWRSRVDIAAEHGLAPFVGRTAESRALDEAYRETMGGHGRVVLIEGDPGVGKSRLVHEFRSRAVEGEAAWRVGRCISYGASIPYLPIVDAFKDAYRVDEIDDDDTIRHKVDAGFAASGIDPAHRPYIEHLLGVEDDALAAMDPHQRKAAVFDAMRAVILTVADARGVVLTIEDLHWADPASIEFLSFLFGSAPEHRLLIVLTFRPGWEQPFGSGPDVVRLTIPALSDEEGARLAGSLVGADRLPEALVDVVLAKADGNPFFIEEVTRSLLETGAIRRENSHLELVVPIGTVKVPNTIQDVISARLDRLDDAPRRAIQTASVIGREFTARLLERAAELGPEAQDSLRELKTTELIHERSLYPELVYMFKHALTHDVAYESLLIARRKLLHQQVGEVTEELYADRLSEQYEILAYHYERAEAWRRAFDYLVASARKALDALAIDEAFGFLDRALAVAEREPSIGPADLIDVHLMRALAYDLRSEGDAAQASFTASIDAAHAAGERRREGAVRAAFGISLAWAHRFEDALAQADAAKRIARETGDQGVMAESLVTDAMVQLVTGRLEAGDVSMDAMDELRASVPSVDGHYLMLRGLSTHWAGRSAEGLPMLIQARDAAIATNSLVAAVEPAWTVGIALCHLGRYDEALEALGSALELSERVREVRVRPRILNTIGWVYGDLCDLDRAIPQNELAVVTAREVNDPEMLRNSELNLADSFFASGRLDDAIDLYESIELGCETPGTWGGEWMKWRYRQHLYASLGEARVAQGRFDEARLYADRCVHDAEGSRSPRNVVKGRRLKAKVALGRSELDEARAEVQRALDLARSMGNPRQLWDTLEVAATVYERSGLGGEAERARMEYADVVAGAVSGLRDPAMAATLRAATVAIAR